MVMALTYELSEDDASGAARVISHLTRRRKPYLKGAALGGAGLLAGPSIGRAAGRQSVDKRDPHYDMNYQAGQATYHDRSRKIRKARMQEALSSTVRTLENLKSLKGLKALQTPEAITAATATGLGTGLVARRVNKGFQQGRDEKRKGAMDRGYQDAYRGKYRESLGPDDLSYLTQDQPTRRVRRDEAEVDPLSEDSLQGKVMSIGANALEIRKNNKVHGLSGDKAVHLYQKQQENGPQSVDVSELQEVTNYLNAARTAAQAVPGAARLSGGLKWTGRGLAATDLAVFGAGAGKAGYDATKARKNKQQPAEVKEGSASTAVKLGVKGAQAAQKIDAPLFGASTVYGLHGKQQDYRDDRKINYSHQTRKEGQDYDLSEDDMMELGPGISGVLKSAVRGKSGRKVTARANEIGNRAYVSAIKSGVSKDVATSRAHRYQSTVMDRGMEYSTSPRGFKGSRRRTVEKFRASGWKPPTSSGPAQSSGITKVPTATNPNPNRRRN